jgi:peptidoglycan hydrolase-like protein with peptidoglycan-binding domain
MKIRLFLSLTLVVTGAFAGVSKVAGGQTPPVDSRREPVRNPGEPWPSSRTNPVVPFFPDKNTVPATKNDRRPDEFRPTSGQVKEAKAILKKQGLYTGKENGKLDKEAKSALKVYQRTRNIKPTGMLDKSTLADMGIPLTKEQERREERYTQIRPFGN